MEHYALVVGIPSVSQWPTVFTKELEKGRFFLALVANSAESPCDERGRAIIEQAQVLTQKTTVSSQELLDFCTQVSIAGIEISCGVVFENEVLCCVVGPTKVLLQRQGVFHPVVVGAATGSAQCVKGTLEKGDRLFFASAAFFERFEQVLDPEKPIDQLADICATALQTLENQSATAGVLVEWQPEKPEAAARQTPTLLSDDTSEESAQLLAPTPPVPLTPLRVKRIAVSQQKRTKLYAILAIIGVFIGVFFGINFVTSRMRDARVSAQIHPFEQRVTKAKETLASDKTAALRELKNIRSELEERKEKTASDRRLHAAFLRIFQDVEALYSQHSKEKILNKLTVYYDFRLIAQDFVATAIGHDRPGKLGVFLDATHGRALSLSLEKKQAQVLSIDEKIRKPIALAVESRKAYVLGDEGVLELSLPLDQIGRMVINRTDSWQSPKFVDVFGTNAYVFDEGQRNLFKYDLEDLSASPSGWIRNKEGFDFEKITGIRIDGEVWFSTVEGQILQYVRGENARFSFSGMLEEPQSTLSVYTHQSTDKLYVLEPRANRIVVLTKQGQYLSSVISPDLATASSLIVDEESRTAYVLAGSLVYEVKLETGE